MLISEPLGGTVDFPHQISNHSGISPRKLVELWYQPLIICNTKFTTQILQGKQQQNQSSYGICSFSSENIPRKGCHSPRVLL